MSGAAFSYQTDINVCDEISSKPEDIYINDWL